ncbi:Acyl-CoA-binding domain-containing protein 6 [Mytilus coruscus]|uniref:Acyl-CoA-binding domain-containing protein 6 n=1 Tax=Mytilus coruscus TaxID=42192 RepID=A0A6J8D2V9_MYTCO|nr:Acyl-CoA-binding domain-containing protein 6 [Mytilus coruscus]
MSTFSCRGEDTNNERTIAIIADISDKNISTFCQTTISLQQFHIMVKNGLELEALQTCSSPMLGEFKFELASTYFCNSKTNSGNWAYASGDETFSSLNITYTGSTSCSVKVGHSENGNVGCLLCIQISNYTYITSIINLDTNIDNALYYKFTCMVTKADGDNVTISQRARVCHKEQKADTMPDTTPLYPIDINVVAAELYLVPNGNVNSKEANCFPKPESTSSSPALPRKRRFVFDIRTALTAGMGSSRKRQKSFVQQNGSNILIVHKSIEDRVMTDETEMYHPEMSPVRANRGSHYDDKNNDNNCTMPTTMVEKSLPFLHGNEKEGSDNSEITSTSVVQIIENSLTARELLENVKSSNDNNDTLPTTMVESIVPFSQGNADEGRSNLQNTRTSVVKTFENTLPAPGFNRLFTQDQIKNEKSSTQNNGILPATMVEQILPFSQGHDEKGSKNSNYTSISVERTFEKTLPGPELQRLPTRDQMINTKSSNDNNDTLPTTMVEPILHFSQGHNEKGSENSKNTSTSVEKTFENILPTPELQKLPTQEQIQNMKSSNDNNDTLPTTMVEQLVPFSQQRNDEEGSDNSENTSTSVVQTFEKNTLPAPELQRLPTQDQIQNTKRSNDNNGTLPTTMVEQLVPFSKQGSKEGSDNPQNIVEVSSRVLTFENTLHAPTQDQIKNVKSSNISDTAPKLHFRNSTDAQNNQSKNINEEVVMNDAELLTNEQRRVIGLIRDPLVTEKLKPRDSKNGNDRLREIQNRNIQSDHRLTNSTEKEDTEVYKKENSINKTKPKYIDSRTIDMIREYSDTNDCNAIASSNQPMVRDINSHMNDDITKNHQNVSKKLIGLSLQSTEESNSDQKVIAYGNDVKDRRNHQTESNVFLSCRTETMRKTGDYIWNIETKSNITKSTIFLDPKMLPEELKKSPVVNQSLQNQKKKKATEGQCNSKKPGMFDFQGKQKWEAWKKLGDKPRDMAMLEYISHMTSLYQGWEAEIDTIDDKKSSSRSSWVSVSIMSNTDPELDNKNKTVFDWCKEGDVNQLSRILQSENIDINGLDDAGMALLHWACERGLSEMVECLLNKKANIDIQTPLHYAVSCEHPKVVQMLLSHGADKSLRDSDRLSPSELETSEEIRTLLGKT